MYKDSVTNSQDRIDTAFLIFYFERKRCPIRHSLLSHQHEAPYYAMSSIPSGKRESLGLALSQQNSTRLHVAHVESYFGNKRSLFPRTREHVTQISSAVMFTHDIVKALFFVSFYLLNMLKPNFSIQSCAQFRETNIIIVKLAFKGISSYSSNHLHKYSKGHTYNKRISFFSFNIFLLHNIKVLWHRKSRLKYFMLRFFYICKKNAKEFHSTCIVPWS